MKIEEIKAGQPMRVGEITLVPIEHTFVSCESMEGGVVVRGSKGLAGIVVVSGKNRYAIDLTGEEVAVGVQRLGSRCVAEVRLNGLHG